ncbi:FAD-dependent oxidoreductase [Rhizobium tumorigenes]|uniref:FAD-dependent oxidoreductase n=1 Tax=Rhizobium tumorigenes TaxID=2041385 RepID=UPI00241D32BC|nr:FAD-dependent oxidoreductase [Rhizobium tumorigenes]WFS03322.1 FAD-dependent oxidoreductase [Rhizobium tumorigenes]
MSSSKNSEENHFDVVVLGAGISGLVCASVLARRKPQRILIIEEYSHVGGNHLDWSWDDYTFDIGSLIFQDDSPLLAHFPQLLDLYVPITPEWARLNPQGSVTAYPISIRDDILGGGAAVFLKIIASVIYARIFQRRMHNARDFARFWIGGFLLGRSGLESYMERFYGVPVEEIDIDLAKKRMLWISEHASLRNVLRRIFKSHKSGPTNRQLARPQTGFVTLYDAAVKELNLLGVQVELSTAITSISRLEDKLSLRLDHQTITADRVISTIPIYKAQKFCGIEPKQQLETSSLIGLFFSFEGERGFAQSIIYNFSHKGNWKRLTMYSDFYGCVRGRQYFGVEVIVRHGDGSVEVAHSKFIEHVHENRLFKGDLKLEGGMTLDHAYPVYKKGAAQVAEDAIGELRMFGIESLGRQGGFNYQPTARASTVEAEAALAN